MMDFSPAFHHSSNSLIPNWRFRRIPALCPLSYLW